MAKVAILTNFRNKKIYAKNRTTMYLDKLEIREVTLMWNMLIVLLIAIAIWFFGSSINSNLDKSSLKSITSTVSTAMDKDGKPKSVVDSLTERTVQQINDARQLQEQEQQSLDNQ